MKIPRRIVAPLYPLKPRGKFLRAGYPYSVTPNICAGSRARSLRIRPFQDRNRQGRFFSFGFPNPSVAASPDRIALCFMRRAVVKRSRRTLPLIRFRGWNHTGLSIAVLAFDYTWLLRRRRRPP